MSLVLVVSFLFTATFEHEAFSFPIHIWEARRDTTTTGWTEDTTLIRLSGANLMWWSKPDDKFLNCPSSFPMITEHNYAPPYSAWPYWYGQLILLPGLGSSRPLGIVEPSYYPLSGQLDSLSWWNSIVDSLVSTLTSHFDNNPDRFYGYWVSDDDQAYSWPYWNMHYAPAIEAICYKLKRNSSNTIKTYMYGYSLNPSYDSLSKFLGKIDSLDIFFCGPFGQFPSSTSWDTSNSQYYQNVQNMFNVVESACSERFSEVRIAGKTPWFQGDLTKDSVGSPPTRRFTEGELRTLVNIGLCYGAKGTSFDWFEGSGSRLGIVEQESSGDYRPFAQVSIPGWNGGRNSSDNGFVDFMRVVHDLRNVGPAFSAIDWDTATTIRETGPGRWPFRYIAGVNNGMTDFSELGVFKEHWLDPVTRQSNIRDYICLVNRHCLSSDSTYYQVNLQKVHFPPEDPPGWCAVDMRNYMYAPLKSVDSNTWYFDRNNWTYYRGGWPRHYDDTLSGVKPGEGKLFAIVDDPWLWDIQDGITKAPNIDKFASVDTFRVKTYARGELFKNGPRRRDVSRVFFGVYSNTILPRIVAQRTTVDSLMNPGWGWPQGWNSPYIDSCYKDSFNVLLPKGNFLISACAYNRLGEYIGKMNSCMNTLPTATSKFPKMTAYTCGKKVVDPEGVFHLVYTGGMNTTPVVLYARFNPKDSIEAIPESLYTGTYPKPETLGVGKFPTIVVKHGNPKDTLVVAWLSQYADTIYYRVKVDSVWSLPYLLDWWYVPNTFSVPRMALGLNDTVYYTYMKKISFPQSQLSLICGKFAISNPTLHISGSVPNWIPPGAPPGGIPLGPIDSLGAAIVTDYNGVAHMAWLQGPFLLHAIAYPGGIWIGKLDSLGPSDLPCAVCAGPYTVNASIVWPQNNKLIRSYFYVEDTLEIFRDTVNVGSDTIKQIAAKDGFVSWKEAGRLYQSLWDAVNRTWSSPETLGTDMLEGFYPQLEAGQFIDISNNLLPARYAIWTEKASDTLFYLTGDIKKYGNRGEYGIMPAAYLKLGQPQSTPFTVLRDGIRSFGSEDYKHVDIGYDSLIYHLPSVNPNHKGRILVESYFDIGDTTASWLYRLVVNDTIIKDSIAVYSRQLSRTTEFLPPQVMSAGQLTIKLIKLTGDYVPCARIILTTFEQNSIGSGGGGQQSKKLQNLPKTFMLFQNLPNPFTKTTAIRYALPVQTKVSLKIYDVMGRLVRKLVDSEQAPGFYTINWNGKDDQSRSLASGVYFYRLATKEFKSTKKVVELK